MAVAETVAITNPTSNNADLNLTLKHARRDLLFDFLKTEVINYGLFLIFWGSYIKFFNTLRRSTIELYNMQNTKDVLSMNLH